MREASDVRGSERVTRGQSGKETRRAGGNRGEGGEGSQERKGGQTGRGRGVNRKERGDSLDVSLRLDGCDDCVPRGWRKANPS